MLGTRIATFADPSSSDMSAQDVLCGGQAVQGLGMVKAAGNSNVKWARFHKQKQVPFRQTVRSLLIMMSSIEAGRDRGLCGDKLMAMSLPAAKVKAPMHAWSLRREWRCRGHTGSSCWQWTCQLRLGQSSASSCRATSRSMPEEASWGSSETHSCG